MLVWKYYICTKYGISQYSYSGKDDQYVGMGQGNKFLDDMCRHKSYLIITEAKKEELGV